MLDVNQFEIHLFYRLFDFIICFSLDSKVMLRYVVCKKTGKYRVDTCVKSALINLFNISDLSVCG